MKNLVYGPTAKQGEFLGDSTMFKIHKDYNNEMFKDFEAEINKGSMKVDKVLPHKYAFQIFIDTVQIKLTIDILIYYIMVAMTLYVMILAGSYHQQFFIDLNDDYIIANAW